jgi:hypothetical protein
MAIDRVTITGADDSIRPEELLPLTQEFPFVEWGILASQHNTWERVGTVRYPPPRWIAALQDMEESGELPNLAMHINGIWVRRLLRGENIVPENLFTGFNRVQLNFHAERNACNPADFADCLKSIGKTFIFQLDGAKGNAHLNSARAYEVRNCFGLFDVSGGAGILPSEWPKPIYLDVQPGGHGGGEEYHDYHGYAGGLGPENLAEQIPLILKASAGTEHAREGRIWIDMETRVRSDDDRQFDLAKVRRCLEIAAPYVKQPATVGS